MADSLAIKEKLFFSEPKPKAKGQWPKASLSAKSPSSPAEASAKAGLSAEASAKADPLR